MFEFPRAAAAAGLAASLMAATSVFALDASKSAPIPIPVPAPSPVALSPHDDSQAVALVSNGVAAKPAGDPDCPSVAIAPDGGARKAEGAKATLDALARDCANLGAETILKVALVGEGERKKSSAAAGFDAPLTILIKDAEGREVENRKVNLRVEMPEGVQKVSFQHVEENVSLPPPSANGYANWTIVVGLDPAAPEAAEVAASEEEVEPVKAERPTRSSRYSKSKRSRSARATAVRRASRVARRQARPQPAPVAAVSPDGVRQPTVPTAPAPGFASPDRNASPWKKVATSFTERRDNAKRDQQLRAQQQAQARARQPGQPPQPPQLRTAQSGAAPGN